MSSILRESQLARQTYKQLMTKFRKVSGNLEWTINEESTHRSDLMTMLEEEEEYGEYDEVRIPECKRRLRNLRISLTQLRKSRNELGLEIRRRHALDV